MKRPCPVCGSAGRRRVLHRLRFVDGPLGDGYDVAVCGKCGAGFADGIPAQAELDRYYAERSKYEYAQNEGSESPYDFRRFEFIADQIDSLALPRDAAILDVGCATGGLLGCLGRRGYGSLLGADPSPACAAAAGRLHGVKVLTATVGALAGQARRFDLILVVGVLEHLREAAPAVSTLADLLTPGGILYAAQPDVASFAECVNAPFQQFSFEHINYFSEHSLGRLMAQAGLGPRRTWHWMVEWRSGVTDSVVSGAYGPARSAVVGPDPETCAALERYLERSREQDGRLAADIANWVRTQDPVIIWGAGTLARRLLASTDLSKANIAAFVDANPHVQGRRLAGRDVLAPSKLDGRSETILICSRAFEQEIIETIRRLGLRNQVKTMGQ